MRHGSGAVLLELIDRMWRTACTGFALAFIFAGGALAAITIFPAIAMVTSRGAERHERTQLVIHRIFRFYVRLLQALGVIDLRVEGAEVLARSRGLLVIANHPSLLDVVLLMSLMPRTQCIVKHQLWTSRYLGGVMRSAGYIRNDLDASALLEACAAAMASGRNLVIFPEGTRSRPGKMLPFQRGFANIALLAGAEILPVTIVCRPPTLFKGEPWWKVPPRRPEWHVMVGERLDARNALKDECRSLAARHLVQRMERYFAERLADV